MRRKPDNPLIPGLDEAELLAWIEGDVDDATDDRIQRVLKTAPADAARQVVAMRRDAILLNTARDEAAPSGLVSDALARAETSIERDLLVGLGDSEPVSFEEFARVKAKRGWLESLGFEPVVGRVAVAALLLLATVAGVYFALDAFLRPVRPAIETPELAATTPQASPVDPEISSEPPVELAANDTPVEEKPAPIEPAAKPEPMTTARALALAGEHRLLITIRSDASWMTSDRLHQLAAERSTGRAWSISSHVPTDVVAALDLDDTPSSFTPSRREIDPAFAGTEVFDPIDLEIAPLPPVPVLGPSVFLASSRADEASFQSLLDTLTRGPVTGIDLTELEVALPQEQGPPMTREAVLWWGRPIAEWTAPVRVPVVVD